MGSGGSSIRLAASSLSVQCVAACDRLYEKAFAKTETFLDQGGIRTDADGRMVKRAERSVSDPAAAYYPVAVHETNAA
jgi:hypothetical protein